MSKLYTVIISVILVVASCVSKDEKQAWEIANNSTTNKEELTKFLQYYKSHSDRKRYKAACFLVANMQSNHYIDDATSRLTYDVDIIVADSLIASVEYSFGLFDSSPFIKEYTFDNLCEYLLPYRIANEPLEYYWREDIPLWLNVDEPTDDILKMAQQINAKISTNTSRDSWNNPQLGYTATISGQLGKCDDRAILATMAFRSFGIPAAFEFIPQWGNTNTGHSISSVIMSDGSIVAFQNEGDYGGNIFMANKTPKIYRKTFAEHRNTILYKYRATESIPELFNNHRVKDVTSLHRIGQTEVNVEVKSEDRSKIVYLAIFSPSEWVPIAYAENCGIRTQFKNIGTGSGQIRDENVGNGILYLPCLYLDNKIVPLLHPVIVSDSGVRNVVAKQEKERIVLTRKYPRIQRIVNFAKQMVGGVFEGANRADFSDAVELSFVSEPPLSRLQTIEVNGDFKYYRYRKLQGTFSIGEFRLLDENKKEIGSQPVTATVISDMQEIGNMYDSNPLSFFEVVGALDLWAGVERKTTQKAKYIEFCPRNDDNEVSPNDEYELFYWDGEWTSLGREVATDFFLEYDNVPKGALLWLRNLTKGKEERPFTYENSTQIWW